MVDKIYWTQLNTVDGTPRSYERERVKGSDLVLRSQEIKRLAAEEGASAHIQVSLRQVPEVFRDYFSKPEVVRHDPKAIFVPGNNTLQ